MRKTVLLYGIAFAVLIGILMFIEDRFIVRDLTLKTYLGIVAALFTGPGFWAGLRLPWRNAVVAPQELTAQ